MEKITLNSRYAKVEIGTDRYLIGRKSNGELPEGIILVPYTTVTHVSMESILDIERYHARQKIKERNRKIEVYLKDE